MEMLRQFLNVLHCFQFVFYSDFRVLNSLRGQSRIRKGSNQQQQQQQRKQQKRGPNQQRGKQTRGRPQNKTGSYLIVCFLILIKRLYFDDHI